MKKKIKMFLKNPLWIVVFLNNRGLHLLNDELYLKLLYWLSFGKRIDLKNPKTYNEKLQWLKLYDRKDIYTKMVDKYESKKLIADVVGRQYVVPTLGIYDKFEDINFETLPKSFVIKTTHYGGNKGIFIVKDKQEFDKLNAKKELQKIMKKNLYYSGREWPYKNIKPRIIIEEFLDDKEYNELRDYKFYCFNGKMKIWFICSERNKSVKFTFFDRNGDFLKIKQCGAQYDEKIEKPKNLNKMIEISEKLSEKMLHLRVDFYEVNGKVYVGELTFYDSSGLGKFDPEEWDNKIGAMLKLPIEENK